MPVSCNRKWMVVVAVVVVTTMICHGVGSDNCHDDDSNNQLQQSFLMGMERHEGRRAFVEEFKGMERHLDGEVVWPWNATYDGARYVWNMALVQGKPFAVVFAGSREDVVRTLQLCHRHGVAVTARSNRHSYEGFSTMTDSVVVDVSRLQHFHIYDDLDSISRSSESDDGSSIHNSVVGRGSEGSLHHGDGGERGEETRGKEQAGRFESMQWQRRARRAATRHGRLSSNATVAVAELGAGLQLVEVYALLAAAAGKTGGGPYYFVGGTCPTVGLAGFTLGGGYGFLSRNFGVAIDSLLQIEVVLANGTVCIANDTVHSDVFWALRGGGNGNFGVVTTFWFLVHRIPQEQEDVCIYNAAWDNDANDAVAVVQQWQQWAPMVDRRLTSQMNLNKGSVTSTGQFLGGCEELESLLQPLLQGTVATTSYSSMPFLNATLGYAGCNNLRDCLALAKTTPEPSSAKFKAKSGYIDATNLMSTGDITNLLFYMNDGFRNCCQDNWAGIIMTSYGGQINAVPEEATSFPHRSKAFHLQFMVYWSTDHRGSGSDAMLAKQWIDSAYRSVEAIDGAYRNYCDLDLMHWETAYYGETTYAKLQQLKGSLDPTNIFRYPQSIRLPS